MPDHALLFVSIPPEYCVARTIGLLKGKNASELMGFEQKASGWFAEEHFGLEVIV